MATYTLIVYNGLNDGSVSKLSRVARAITIHSILSPLIDPCCNGIFLSLRQRCVRRHLIITGFKKHLVQFATVSVTRSDSLPYNIVIVVKHVTCFFFYCIMTATPGTRGEKNREYATFKTNCSTACAAGCATLSVI